MRGRTGNGDAGGNGAEGDREESVLLENGGRCSFSLAVPPRGFGRDGRSWSKSETGAVFGLLGGGLGGVVVCGCPHHCSGARIVLINIASAFGEGCISGIACKSNAYCKITIRGLRTFGIYYGFPTLHKSQNRKALL